MTNLGNRATLAAGALLLCVLSGCGGDASDRPTMTSTPSPAPTSSSPPTPTQSIPSDTESAAETAASVVHEYFRTVDQLRQRPREKLRALSAVATSGELAAQKRLIQSERRRGLRQLGETRVARLKVQSVNLDNSDPEIGKVPTAQIDVCWNVSDVDVIDRSGASVVSSSRPDTGGMRLTVANYDWSSNPDGGWRVASSEDLEQQTCAAS